MQASDISGEPCDFSSVLFLNTLYGPQEVLLIGRVLLQSSSNDRPIKSFILGKASNHLAQTSIDIQLHEMYVACERVVFHFKRGSAGRWTWSVVETAPCAALGSAAYCHKHRWQNSCGLHTVTNISASWEK
ncbi:uncharacterized [Tachysurus ichikawai]